MSQSREDPDACRGTPVEARPGRTAPARDPTRRPGSPSDDRRGVRHGRALPWSARPRRPRRRSPPGARLTCGRVRRRADRHAPAVASRSSSSRRATTRASTPSSQTMRELQVPRAGLRQRHLRRRRLHPPAHRRPRQAPAARGRHPRHGALLLRRLDARGARARARRDARAAASARCSPCAATRRAATTRSSRPPTASPTPPTSCGLIREEGFDFAVGAACHPEAHPEALDPATDLAHLRRKVDAGVDFLITQLFFDNAVVLHVRRARARGRDHGADRAGDHARHERRPARALHQPLRRAIPPDLLAALHEVRDDPQAVLDLGVAYATLQCAELLRRGAPGIHFYTLNRSPATRAILHALRLHQPWRVR